MIKQNIFIINFDSLYEILDEIKENLSFKIIKFENEDDFIKDTHLDITNSLIISKFKEKLIVKKNIWGYSPDMETHTVETHIYRLRKKISNKFNDENLY